jgi:hypothetical protein
LQQEGLPRSAAQHSRAHRLGHRSVSHLQRGECLILSLSVCLFISVLLPSSPSSSSVANDQTNLQLSPIG